MNQPGKTILRLRAELKKERDFVRLVRKLYHDTQQGRKDANDLFRNLLKIVKEYEGQIDE